MWLIQLNSLDIRVNGKSWFIMNVCDHKYLVISYQLSTKFGFQTGLEIMLFVDCQKTRRYPRNGKENIICFLQIKSQIPCISHFIVLTHCNFSSETLHLSPVGFACTNSPATYPGIGKGGINSCNVCNSPFHFHVI